MDLKQLKYFLSVAEYKSFSRASEHIFIAQPALSRHIKHLEEELNVSLLERHPRGIQLTEVGENLKNHAEAIIKLVEESRKEISSYSLEPGGELTVCFPPSLHSILTLPIILEFNKSFPAVTLKVMEGLSVDMVNTISTGHADMAIVFTVEPSHELHCVPLVTEPMYFVGPPDSSFDSENPIGLKNVVDYPLILTSSQNGLRRILDKKVFEERLNYKPIAEINSIQLLVDLVSSGMGYTVLPGSRIETPLKRRVISATRLRGIDISWMLINSISRPVSPAMREMEKSILNRAKTLVEKNIWKNARIDF